MSDKEIKLHILNIKNKKITAKAISDILKKYDIKHKIKNLELFQEALTPSSYVENSSENSRLTKIIADKNLIPISEDESKKCVPLEKKSYQRLKNTFRKRMLIRGLMEMLLKNLLWFMILVQLKGLTT